MRSRAMTALINPWTLVLMAASREIFGFMRFQLTMQQAKRLIESGYPEHLDKLAAILRADRSGVHWPLGRRP
jgi:hypothetical protein